VVRVRDFVVGLVVEVAQTAEGRLGGIQASELEGEVGDVDRGEGILGPRLGQRYGGLERVVEPALAPVDLRERAQRLDVAGIVFERLSKVLPRLVRVAGGEGEVPEVDERRRVVRAHLERPPEGVPCPLEVTLLEAGPCLLDDLVAPRLPHASPLPRGRTASPARPSASARSRDRTG
jgi:hypothetical protein